MKGRDIQSAPSGIEGFVPGQYNWPVDFSVKAPGWGSDSPAKAVAGHHRQCQGTKRKSVPPKQCRKWSVPGRRFCKFHGGHLPLHRKRKMGGFFTKNGNKALKELLIQDERHPEEQLSLLEELSIGRQLGLKALNRYASVQAMEDASDDLKNQAYALARGAIEYVAELAVKAAKVRAHSERVIDVEHIDYISALICRIVENECDPETAARVAKKVQDMPMPFRNANQTKVVATEIIDAVKEMEEATHGTT